MVKKRPVATPLSPFSPMARQTSYGRADDKPLEFRPPPCGDAVADLGRCCQLPNTEVSQARIRAQQGLSCPGGHLNGSRTICPKSRIDIAGRLGLTVE